MRDSDTLRNLVRKQRKRTGILTDAEVELASKAVRLMLGPAVVATAYRSGFRVEDGIRWGALGARCGEERGKRGLSIRQVATELRVPQYRLQAVEEGTLGELKADVAHRYFRYLGLEAWVRRWAKANRELANRTGITPWRVRRVER